MGTTSSFLNQFVHSQIPSPPPAIAQGAKVEVATKLSKSNRSPGVPSSEYPRRAAQAAQAALEDFASRGEKGGQMAGNWWFIPWNMMENSNLLMKYDGNLGIFPWSGENGDLAMGI